MKYFTKEELEDITRELLENPTRETLKKLNEKYNTEVEVGEPLAKEIPFIDANTYVIPEIEAPVMENNLPEVAFEETQMVSPIVTSINETPVVNQAPNFNVLNNELPNVENAVNGEVPFFEAPKMETPISNNQNNNPINFNGNLFEVPNQPIVNLMQTTDNFNSVPNTMPTTEVPVNQVPFFGPYTETINNPIPVNSAVNNMPNTGPTMFGQFEQNYM